VYGCGDARAQEDSDYPGFTSLTFTDFLEALARLSDVRVLPSPMELSSCGWDNVYQWCASLNLPQPNSHWRWHQSLRGGE
jgi:hypothetical protein